MTKREKSQKVWEHINSDPKVKEHRYAYLFGLMEAYEETEKAFDHYIKAKELI